MSGTDSGGFRFVSHHRTGLIALPGVAASGTVTASATLSDGSTTPPVTIGVAGPGDIQGIDLTQVTRQYPRPGATDAETEFFPLVEFASPALPWLVPTPTVAQGPLPWLCLVAVAVGDGVSVTSSGPGLPDKLHIGGSAKPAQELPDPATAVLWAHAFAATSVHTDGSADPVQNGTAPAPAGCRLLAPRKLEPQTSYIACLVPVLKATALAGLGHPDADIQAALAAPAPNYAWSASDASVDLPAYLHWEFSCGAVGDFESLARALKEVPVDPSFGTRPLDLGLAGAGMPVTTTTATVFRGALTAPGVPAAAAWPDPANGDQVSVDTAMVAEIGTAAKLTAAAASAAPGGRPAIGPLLYARAAAGRSDVTSASPAADWFDQLNRDPRMRATAGLGTRILRRNVEDVMARAWDQVGDVEQANSVLRRLQASRAVTASLHTRHLSALSPGRLVSLARPVLGRVALPAAVTGGAARSDALAAVAASALPAGTTWRGVGAALRPGTRLGEAAARGAAIGTADAPGRVLTGLAGGVAEPSFVPDGTVSLAPPSAVLGARAASVLTAGVRTAAAAAGIAVPAQGAAAAQASKGLDTLAQSAGKLAAKAATSLAAQTSTAVLARALPTSVSISQLAGVLTGAQDLQTAVASTGLSVHPTTTAASAGTTAPAPASAAGPKAQPAAAAQAKPADVALGKPITTAPAKPITTTPPITTKTPVTTTPPISTTPAKPVVVTLSGTDPRLTVMRSAYASALDRYVCAGTATAPPAAGSLNLTDAKTALLANLDPAHTVPALATAQVPALAGRKALDPVAPVMAGPVFTDAAYAALVTASHDAFVPGLDSVPADSVTLLQTNPEFIAAYLAGLNSALGHELLWRGYPTDERGTYWYSFWGTGSDIGPLHQFTGALAANVAQGTQPLLVLVLRGRLLQRYPDADVYAVLASGNADLPELDDGTAITRPLFRDAVSPDITLVGFQLTYDEVVGTGTAQGYWFVIAEHPGQPRFGLTDPDPAITHPPLPTWDELSWADLGATAANASYVPAPAPPMSPAATTRHWAASAADMAAITYQPAVRIAIRARDLLAATAATAASPARPTTPSSP
jgi:hypothetical protein